MEDNHQKIFLDKLSIDSLKIFRNSSSNLSTFSINKALAEPISYKKLTFSSKNLPSEEYTFAKFEYTWNLFLKNPKILQNIPLWNILNNLKWELKDNYIILLYFSSHVAIEEFSLIKQQCLEYFYKMLNNYYIQFKLIVKVIDKKSKIIFSQKKKYISFIKKNHYIIQLQKRLGLELYD